MIGPAIYAMLNVPLITNIVGKSIFPNYARLDQPYPQVVYDVKNPSPQTAYRQNLNLVSIDVSIAGIAKTYAQSTALAKAIIAVMDEEQGTFGGFVVQGSFWKDSTEEQETNPESEEILYYIKELSFSVWYQPN